MQFTSAQLKAAFEPYIAATGRQLDVAALKAAQGSVPETVKNISRNLGSTGLAKEPTLAEKAARIDEAYDRLVAASQQHGGLLGSVAEMEAGRQRAHADLQHDAKLGFSSLVRAYEGTYEAVRKKGIGGARLLSAQEAAVFATEKLQDIRSNLLAINRHGGGDADVGAAYKWLADESMLRDPVHAWMDARNRDWLEGSRMQLFINTRYLEATFGIQEPILETVDGKLRIRAFDIEFGGTAIGRSVGDGTIALYRADGTLELDRTI